MLVKIPEPWRLQSREETPESVFRDRRRILRGMFAAGLLPRIGLSQEAPKAAAPTRNPVYALDRPLTDEKLAASHNIFDEFSGKRDDSTFLSDEFFGNSMLLPNKDLDKAYQKVDLSGSYQFHPLLSGYASIENLFDRDYEASFGFPALPLSARIGFKLTFGGVPRP